MPNGSAVVSEVSNIRVLVSGGTSGLGYAMSAALVAGGAHVVLTGRDAARTAAAALQLASSGQGRGIGVTMDVRDERSVHDGVTATTDALGVIHVLVNNAGIGMRTINRQFMTDPQPFWTVEPNRFRDLFETNVTGYFVVARLVAPVMVQSPKGKIVNISVSETTTRRAGFAPYGPSRAATDPLSHIMAVRPCGIRSHREPARTRRGNGNRHGPRRPGRGGARQPPRTGDHGTTREVRSMRRPAIVGVWLLATSPRSVHPRHERSLSSG
jgi:gluconate 5-dehydrogenase